MARASLFQNKKFKRLVALLGVPRPYVVGLLETMWHVCYETGDPMFKDLDEIEAAAEWPGENSQFAKAAISAGLIDPTGSGRYEVHNFWDHAPRAVNLRRKREDERRNNGLRQKRAHIGAQSGAESTVSSGATPDSRLPTPDTRKSTYTTTTGAGAGEAEANRPLGDEAGQNGTERSARRRGPHDDGEANRAIGNQPGADLINQGDRRRAPAETGPRADAEPPGGDAIDPEIRDYIGRHPFLTYDLKTHENVRTLVEQLGWGRTEELINRGVREGKKFPAGWAIGCLAGIEREEGARAAHSAGAGGGENGRRKTVADRSEEALRRAFAEIKAEGQVK